MVYAAMRFWGRKPPPPPDPAGEATGGPERDEGFERRQRRIGFIERRLDRLTKRVDRLEEVVTADAIAPLEPPQEWQNGAGR